MNYYCGIDIGSSYIKIAIINENKELIASKVSLSGSSFRRNAESAFDDLLEANNLSAENIKYTVSTGYGRRIFTSSNENISEITANAKGKEINGSLNNIKTIINIGGQDTKVISLDKNGIIKNFAMNDKCAAGTGKFLDVAAKILEVDIEDLESLHLNSNSIPTTINSTCTVFAETEIISLLSKEENKSSIAAGVHYSIAKRVARLAHRVGIEDDILFDGGAALNLGVHKALEDELMRKIIISKHPQITTAIGAAIIAKEKFSK